MQNIPCLRQITLLLSWITLFQANACAQKSHDDNDIPVIEQEEVFGPPVVSGDIEGTEIQEASGLAASPTFDQSFWTHNDSGGSPIVYLISAAGQLKGKVLLSGANNRDWEDIAIGPGPEANVNYIYVGEIGDNNARYNEKRIYRFPEPGKVSGLDVTDTVHNADIIRYVYPDGPRDAETLFVDPLTKNIYILSKREASVNIYSAAYPQDTKNVITLEKLGTLPLVAENIRDQIVAGDITQDGLEILLKSYNKVYYWQRNDVSTSITDLLQSEPTELPYTPEPQGESITFATDNSGYYTLSEKRFTEQQRLYFYKRK